MTHLPVPPKGHFYDLNLPYDENLRHLELVVQTLKDLGYSAFALSKYIASGSLKKNKNTKKPEMPSAPEKSSSNELLQLSRVTIELKEIDDQITVRDIAASSRFDIIAVEPKTEKLFLTACTQLTVDIITIDGSEKLPFFFRTHQVQAAITRGIQFEFNYAPMIRDPTNRRLTTTSALRLVECCKSKNIIMCSKALHPIELRGPHDVANLGMLFAIKESVVPHIVSHNCRCAIIHSFVRKTAKGAIYLERITDADVISKRFLDHDHEENAGKKARITQIDPSPEKHAIKPRSDTKS